MSQTYKQNNDAKYDKNECCICYSEEGNKLIECCPNKHLLCVKCFHESYKRNCECPLCRDLMYRPEIMTNDEDIAYYNAKVAKLELKYKKEREELRQNQLVQAKMRKQRQEQLERLQVRKTEQIQIIQSQNDELMRQIAINNAKIENINKLELDEYNAIYPEPRELTLPNDSDSSMSLLTSDSDSDDELKLSSQVEFDFVPVRRQILKRPQRRQRPLVEFEDEEEEDFKKFESTCNKEIELLNKLKIPQLKELLKTFNFTKFSKLKKQDLVLKICELKIKNIYKEAFQDESF